MKSPGMSPSRTIGALAGALAVLLGSVVLVGWAIHSTSLIQVAPNLAPMQRNTALGFILTGLALLGIVIGKPKLTFSGSAATITLAAVTLLEYLFRVNFGIDELLGVAYIRNEVTDPGRMAPTTALCFIILTGFFLLVRSSLITNRSALLGW